MQMAAFGCVKVVPPVFVIDSVQVVVELGWTIVGLTEKFTDAD